MPDHYRDPVLARFAVWLMPTPKRIVLWLSVAVLLIVVGATAMMLT